jgi:hypothetical protein
VLRAMAKDPAERFDSVRSFGAALLPFASERVQSRWAHAFPVQSATKTMAAAFVEPPLALEKTVSPQSPTIAGPFEPPQQSSAMLVLAAVFGLLFAAVTGGTIWWMTQPVETVIVDVAPVVTPPVKTEVAPKVEEASPSIEPVEEEEEEETPSEAGDPAPAKKKKKKKVATGSNNAPILE